MTPADTTTRHGISCTTLPRTLLDLAAVVDRRALERAIDRAELLRAFDLAAIEAQIERGRGRRGARALANAISSYSEPLVTRSAAEERMLELVAAAELPRPRTNAWIALEGGSGYEADFLWERAKLIVEIDGRSYHQRRRAFRHDRRRDRLLALAGYETRRYDSYEIFEEPERVAQEVKKFLYQPPSAPQASP